MVVAVAVTAFLGLAVVLIVRVLKSSVYCVVVVWGGGVGGGGVGGGGGGQDKSYHNHY